MRKPLLFLLIPLLTFSACKKSDAELAAKERKAYLKQIEKDSGTLTVYRFAKLTIRANSSPNPPPELECITKEINRILSAEGQEKQSIAKEAEDIARTATMLYKAQKMLNNHNEDDYPLFWKACTQKPLPTSWYDNGAEHLGLAYTWTTLNMMPVAGKSIPSQSVTTIANYEMAQATPGPLWPKDLKIMHSVLRGITFLKHQYHYASDEEFTRCIQELQATPPEQFSLFGAPSRELHTRCLGASYLLRAWNRVQLKRNEAASKDFEDGLQRLSDRSEDNEGLLWIGAFNALQQKQYEIAGQKLEKLSKSSYLSVEDRDEIHAEAKRLQRGEYKSGFFAKQRAGLCIAYALIQRGGGPEKLISRMVGDENAQKFFSPIHAVNHFQQSLAQATDPKKWMTKADDAIPSLWQRIKFKCGFGTLVNQAATNQP